MRTPAGPPIRSEPPAVTPRVEECRRRWHPDCRGSGRPGLARHRTSRIVGLRNRIGPGGERQGGAGFAASLSCCPHTGAGGEFVEGGRRRHELLMEEFYANLWQKKLSRLEALRQAQLTLLNHPERVKSGRGNCGPSYQSVVWVRKQFGCPTAVKCRSAGHPAWWAAFVLSGDGR